MRPIATVLCLCLLVLAVSCRNEPHPASQLKRRIVTLPNGQKITAEVNVLPIDLARGMMFRDSLPPDQGMLFIHDTPGTYTYWMYQVRIPLDIIWMDSNRTVVEVAANVPPCKTKASECPHYGGNRTAQYVLELAAGMAEKYGVRVGQSIVF
jgi:Uncharacterized conserved protein